MRELFTLINKAVKVSGSDSELCKLMSISGPTLCQMKSGARPISPETAAEMAFIGRTSVKKAIYLAMLVRSKGTRREGVMLKILGDM